MPRFKTNRLKKEEEKDDGSSPPHAATIDTSPSPSLSTLSTPSFSMKGKGISSSRTRSSFWSRRSNRNTKKTQKAMLNGSFVSKSSSTVSRTSLASLSSVVKSFKASISSSLSPSRPSPPPHGSDDNNDNNNKDDINYFLLAETMPLFEPNIRTSSLIPEDQAQQMHNATNTNTNTDNHNQVVNQQQDEISDTITIIEDDENNNKSNISADSIRILKSLGDDEQKEGEEKEAFSEDLMQKVDTKCTNEDQSVDTTTSTTDEDPEISYFFEDSMSTIHQVSSVAGETGDGADVSSNSIGSSPSVQVPPLLAASSIARRE